VAGHGLEDAASGADPVSLDEGQKELVRLLQDGFPLVDEPYAELAKELGLSQKDVIGQLRDWKASGVIRRFGAVVNHRRMGFRANAMVAFSVPSDRIDAAGKRLAACSEISHCYHRRPILAWPYNLFAMVHGHSTGQLERFVEGIAAEVEAEEYEILFSVAEYKKTSMKYFCTPAQP
jgi:DNA-binding Lrp family transcriptional regulator